MDVPAVLWAEGKMVAVDVDRHRRPP